MRKEKDLIYLVKPHPPLETLNKKTPIGEDYKYNWEPMVLKIASYFLNKEPAIDLQTQIWHLFDEKDDELFINSLNIQKPNYLVFSEIDILVSEVNRLSEEVRKKLPHIIIIICGKQSSLLRKGDKNPFTYADYVLAGDSFPSLGLLLEKLEKKESGKLIPGSLSWNENFIIQDKNINSNRTDLKGIKGMDLRNIPVINHKFTEYIDFQQKHPSLHSDSVKTAPIFIGNGCPYNCNVCQSSIEYGENSQNVLLREPQEIVEEIIFLINKYGVNNFFSLEPNLNLSNLERIYNQLEDYSINNLSFSGFIRADDITRAAKSGLLKKLAHKGVRVLSIGLDIPLDTEEDKFNKKFSFQSMLQCLKYCQDHGILILATIVGEPDYKVDQFEELLNKIGELPVAGMDIRLAMALRNTKYFDDMKDHLIYHPDEGEEYFKQQNYRYQTISIPGKITPAETYDLVRDFKKKFLLGNKHIEYVLDMVKRHDDTKIFFRKQYLSFFKKRGKYPFLEPLFVELFPGEG
ncbi:MAG: radical SAM protein [bacterium]|nr:radical SAM protein [bacterium]